MKIKLFIFILLVTPLICGVFGILHDQLTYSISEEYYTKFKFVQFGLVDEGMELLMNHRLGAVIVGFMATWWVGIPIGLFYAVILMFFKNKENLYKLFYRTLIITFVITIITSFLGYIYWKLFLQQEPPNWYLPENVVDKNSFFCVGSIHNFSYLGGGIGWMAGMLYLVLQRTKDTPIRKTLRNNI